jgi:superfamily II DNA or RNA helicase
MELYNHQQRFVDIAPNKYGIFHGTGTGKTITGIEKINSLDISNCLIICPKGVASKWRSEYSKNGKFHVLILTKETFRRDWKTIGKMESIIVDEAHHFSSIKSQLHKSLIAYIKLHEVKYVYLMTATPYRREPFNIYALAKILGHNWNYMDFRHKFYYEQYFGMRSVWLPKPNKEKEVAELVRKIGDVVSFEECGDLPPIQHKVEYVELTSEQKKLIGNLEFIEPNPLTFYLRQHQVCSGEGQKDEYILGLLETTQKLCIFCRYTEQIDHYQKLLENNRLVFIIDGRTKDKSEVAKCVELNDKCVLIAQSDSAEGWETPSISTIVFASMSYSFLSYEQSLGRFIRINKQNTPKLFIYLLTKGTIDEDVYKNIMSKKDFSLEIYAKQGNVHK